MNEMIIVANAHRDHETKHLQALSTPKSRSVLIVVVNHISEWRKQTSSRSNSPVSMGKSPIHHALLTPPPNLSSKKKTVTNHKPTTRYVILAASTTLINLMWHAHRGSPYRQAAKMPWPYQHASRAEVNTARSPDLKRALHLFNCAQRAHVGIPPRLNPPFTAIVGARPKANECLTTAPANRKTS